MKLRIYAGLDDERLRKVCLSEDYTEEDQILELHTNLTVVQAKLLQVLQSHWREENSRETQKREVQKQWTEFTISLEDTLNSVSANTSSLMGDLISGLLKLQVFTRDSTEFVANELQSLEGDVQNMRSELRRVQDDIALLAAGGISQVEELAEISQQRLYMVPLSR